jgi:hypothetical protein
VAGVVAAAGEGVIDAELAAFPDDLGLVSGMSGVWMRRRWVPSEDVDVAVSAEPLTLEAAELQEKFQWLTEEQSKRLAG